MSGTVDAGPDGVRWLTAAEQRIWRDYLDFSRLLSERLNRQLVEDSALTLGEYEILVRLSEAPGRRLRMSELADLAVHSRSRLTHTVSRMEERGLVCREAHPTDRRGIDCRLLDEGLTALEAAAPGHVAEVRRWMFDPLDEQEVAGLGAAMCKARNALWEG